VAQWRRSGLTAAEFAVREGLSASSLRWWSSELGRGSRASGHGHDAPAIHAIELAVPSAALRRSAGIVEVAVGNVIIRFDAGVDVGYVASLVRAVGER
jgi:hypothetical protein